MIARAAFLAGLPSPLLGPRYAAMGTVCRRFPVRPRACSSSRRVWTATLPTKADVREASFLDSVRHAETLLGFRKAEMLQENVELLDLMLETSNGSRGFFVTLLSQPDVILADQDPLPAELQYLITKHSTSETVADLIVKNVVMSTAMAEVYSRPEANSPPGLAAGSRMTAERGARILALADSASGSVVPQLVRSMLAALRGASADAAGSYDAFVTKWKYDEVQRKAAAEALEAAVGDTDN